MTTTETFIVTKTDVLKGLGKALANYQVVALTKKGERLAYGYVSNANQIELEYKPTVLPPKKIFYPQQESILEYTSGGAVSAKIEAKPTVLFGIKPCDLNGMKVLNEAFADDHGDPNYLAKMNMTVVIGIDCKKICDEDAFCYKLNTHNAKGAYDIMLHEFDDKYVGGVVTEKGKVFVEQYFDKQNGGQQELVRFREEKEAGFGKETQFKDLDKFPEIFEKSRNHPVWEQEGARCLSCGSCIMVCPTCYCFDVKDEWQLNLKKGERIRCWDACMLSSFAVVSGGENFRHTAKGRLQHRINRKFNWLMTKHKQPVCVGCGRCVRACLVDISPKTIAETLVGEKK